MTNTRHHSFSKKALSVMLTLVMSFSYVGLLSGVFGLDLFGTKQTASAAEGTGKYAWSVWFKTTDDVDAIDNNTYINVDFMSLNGTGEKLSKKITGCSPFESTGEYSWNQDSFSDIPDGYYPYNCYLHLEIKFTVFVARNWKGYCTFTTPGGTYKLNGGNELEWSTSWGGSTKSESIGAADGNYDNYGGTKPYVNACTWVQSVTSVEIPLSGNAYVDKAFEVKEIKDQYGVKWQNSTPSYDIGSGDASIRSTSGMIGNVRFNNNSGVDYTARVRAYWSTSNSSHNPAYLYKDVSVKARHTLTVKANGGNWNGSTANKSYTGHTGDSQSLDVPQRTGYTFDGWEIVSGDGTISGNSFKYKNVGSTVIQAKWSKNTYTATFVWDNVPNAVNPNEPAASATTTQQTYDYEGTFTFPSGLTKDYYTFNSEKQWVVTSDTSGSWTTGAEFNAGSTTTTGKYGNVTFRAQYTPNDYLIEFDTDCNQSIGSNFTEATGDNLWKYNFACADKVGISTRNKLPGDADLYKNGYELLGWQVVETDNDSSWKKYQDNGVDLQTYEKELSLVGMHGNVKLKAVWGVRTSTIKLDLSAGGTIQIGDSYLEGQQEVGYSFDSALVLNNPKRTGYTFKGWRITEVPSSYPGNVPQSSRWIVNSVTDPTDPNYPDYKPSSDTATQTTIDSGKIGDVTLTPVWEHIKYTITYNGNNGTTPSAKDYYIDSAAFALPGSTRNGYDFDGWQVTEHDDVYNWTETTYASGYSVKKGHYGNVTLTAQWKPHVYTITLNVAGGDPLTPNTRTYKITESTGLPTPTRTGYTFTGWKVTSPAATTNWVDGTVFPVNDLNAPSGYYGDLTLTAQWEHKTYTIEKSTNGTNGEDVTYHIDDAAFTLGGSVSAGYNFTGWKVTSAEADCWTVGDVIGADYLISNKYGNVVVEAQFDPIGYEITYLDKDGAQIGETQAYNIKSDDVMIRTYAKDAYTFDGWEVIADASAPNWNNGSTLQPGGPLAANIYYGDVTLKAKLTPIGYTVTFDANGGLPLANLPYNIESAGETDVLPTPTRNGYDFDGWKVTAAAGNWVADATFAAGDAVTGKWGSPTLQAQWTPKKFTITYITGAYPDGITKQGTFNETAPDLNDAEKAKPADAQYTYTFDHWEPGLTTVTGEATYTAVYTKTVNKYNVTWMIPTDVSGAPDNYAGEVSEPIEYGTAPVYNNGVNPTMDSANSADYTWRFAGWSLTAGGEKLESLPVVTENVTYYALFTKVLRPKIVNWVINGVTNSEEWGIGETPEWKHDTPTKPDEDGYRFVFTGWDSDPVPVEQHGGPYTYTAQFSSELQDYTITLNLNGGATDAALEYPYQMGDAVTFPAPERTGYTFAGWKLDEAVGSWPADTVVPAGEYATGSYWGNVSFTAQWTPVSYRITFNAASEDDVLPAALTYTIESTDVIPAATREGHTLNGWIVSVGDGNWTQGATLAAACQLLKNYGNVTLTPMWQVNTYTITWNSEGYIQTSQAEYGSAILSFTPISKMGYTADWDDEVPATMPARDLTFTAVYTPVQYYIRLNVNGGNPVDNFYYTINGDNTLPTPTRAGATFLGWKVASAQGNWTKNALMAGGANLNGKYGNVSLTAQWELDRHTVTWVAGDVTKETVWLYGAVPSYDGTPYKSPDETNSYVFVGWAETPEGDTLESLPTVTADVTYYAQFSKTERKYAVVWNVDGATTTEYYSYGQTPVYPGESDPVRSSTTEYDFTFTGWSPAVGEVTADVTYYAQFDVFTKLQGLSIDVASMFMDIGDDGAVQAQLYPATATVRDVIWTSLNPAVATVDNNGTITAVDAGIALINVSSVDKKFNAYCVVTVSPRHTKYVEITAGGISTTQLAGAMLQLSATIQPDNATDTGIRWSSGDVSVATVDGNGLVKYVGVGETDITAIASDGFSMGSIHVVTTTDETEVENEVKTYLVTFGEFYPGFKFTENGEHYTAGRLYVAEGETIRFKLDVQNSRQSGYSVYANTELMSCDGEYWYTLDNIQNNMIIRFADSAAGIGTPEEDDGGDSGAKLTFFERLAAFFRKIVEFFRGLFKK